VTRFAFPTWWHYDVLRGLEYLRSAGVVPDKACGGGDRLVASKRDGDGRWPLETGTPARCRSRRMRARASRAGGTRCALYEC